jgi:hypothetical protein
VAVKLSKNYFFSGGYYIKILFFHFQGIGYRQVLVMFHLHIAFLVVKKAFDRVTYLKAWRRPCIIQTRMTSTCCIKVYEVTILIVRCDLFE